MRGLMEIDRAAIFWKLTEVAKSELVDIDRTAVVWKLVEIARAGW